MIFIFYESGERYETNHGIEEFQTTDEAEQWINGQLAERPKGLVFNILKIVEGQELKIEAVEFVSKMEIKK
jgi:hypothetical protein